MGEDVETGQAQATGAPTSDLTDLTELTVPTELTALTTLPAHRSM